MLVFATSSYVRIALNTPIDCVVTEKSSNFADGIINS